MNTARLALRRFAAALLFASLLPDCAADPEGNDVSLDGGQAEDGSGPGDVSSADVDAITDVNANADTRSDADDANDTAPEPPPTVTVTAPVAGDYRLGSVLAIAWTASGAETAVLALVRPEACEPGAVGVVVPDMGSVAASAGAYDWAVPFTIATGDYRVRVVVESDSEQAVACSEVLSLVAPPGCETLPCEAENRSCTTAAGEAECGSCVEGFAEADGLCVVIACGAAPAPPANAQFESVSSTQFGGVVTYTCVEGHSTTALAGGGREVTRRCGAEGDWESATAACLPVDCGTSPAPAPNARLSGVDRTTFGGTATYSCAAGYVVSGQTDPDYSVTCGADGAWSSAATCELVDCGPLTAPTNGSVSTDGGTVLGASATFSCDSGYALEGATTRACEASGAWSGSAAVCNPVDCGTPPTVSNGSRTFTSTTFSSTASYDCDSGYARSGSATLTCGATGSWGTAPTCGDTNECASGSVCTATGNSCTNTAGSWQCSCAEGYSGTTVTGGDASCVTTPVGTLGSACGSDSQCPSNSWCSTVSGYRRCSPQLFSGAAHQMDFVFVPAGTFQQGTPSATNEERPYTATISRNYFVSRTEVTQGQWIAATGGTNSSCYQSTTGTSCTTSNANNSGPVENVDWYSTLAYANWLAVNQGLSACYALTPSTCADSVSDWADGVTDCTGATFSGLSCTGYRLLTESEWERAARGGTTSAYYWGETADTATVGLYAWFSGNAGRRTQAVGGKSPNAYGLRDMGGNVWEWVWDWVYTSRTWINYPIGVATDYLGPSSGSARGVRGGSWVDDTSGLRSADCRYNGLVRTTYLGLRLARTAN